MFLRSGHVAALPPPIEVGDTIKMVRNGSGSITLKNVSVLTPSTKNIPNKNSPARLLVRDLSLHLPEGSRLLIMGSSGCGKSSLLRVIAGLWTGGTGEVHRTDDTGTFFAPQRPYCTLGTLRDQLLYPNVTLADGSVSDDYLLGILDAVQLAELPGRMGGLDTIRDYSDVLSLGEQQRLAFGRLLVSKPTLAILDEATSAVSFATERHLYDILGGTGATIVSVGHRPSLLEYHDRCLRLEGDGVWKFSDVEENGNAKKFYEEAMSSYAPTESSVASKN